MIGFGNIGIFYLYKHNVINGVIRGKKGLGFSPISTA